MDPALAPAPIPRTRMNRALKVLIWIAGSVVGATVLLWIALYAYGSSQLKEALASLKSGGYAFSPAEMAPPPVPPERNGAPHYLAAFALLPDDEEEDPALSRAIEEGFAVLSTEEKETVRSLLAKSGEAFAKVKAGAEKGAWRFDRDYAQGLLMEMPDVSDAMRMAKLLRIGAESEAEAGRVPRARESVRNLLALSDAYAKEPLLIFQLIRLAIFSMALEAVDRSVTADTSEADLRAWLETLPQPQCLDGAVQLGFRGELACGAQLAGRPLDETMAAVERSPRKGRAIAGSGLLSPYWKITGARYIRSMIHLVETSRKPYLEARPKLAGAVDRLKSKSVFDMLSILLLPAIHRALDRQAVAQTSLTVIRTGLAAEIERCATGRYPERVEATDALTGNPLVFDAREGRISSAGLPDGRPEDLESDHLIWKLRRLPGPEKK